MSDNVKPLFLVMPESISKDDMARIESMCGIVIVECSDPDGVRLLEPPIQANINEQARAALAMFKRAHGAPIENGVRQTFTQATIISWFVEALLNGRVSTVNKIRR